MRKSNDRKIERDKRLIRLEQHQCRGVTNHQELAAAFGCSPQLIGRDLKLIRERWRDNAVEDADELRQLRKKQFEEVLKFCWTALERSRADNDPCPECVQGYDEYAPGQFRVCGWCGGKGYDPVGMLLPKERAGDPAWVKAIIACIAEICRLEGLYPSGTKQMRVDVQGGLLHGVVSVEHIEGEFADASTDAIIEAKATVRRLLNGNGNGKAEPAKLVDLSEVDAAQTP